MVARRTEAPPLEIDARRWRAIHLSADISALSYAPVTMSGRFEGARQFLLDNRTRNGVAGFHVLTAFIPVGAAGGVMVNRGWIPLDGRRDPLSGDAAGGTAKPSRSRSTPARGQCLSLGRPCRRAPSGPRGASR